MNSFQQLFEEQKALFAGNVTRSRARRVDQLNRIGRMIKENEAVMQNAIACDFKTASQEYVFETAATFFETEYQKCQMAEGLGALFSRIIREARRPRPYRRRDHSAALGHSLIDSARSNLSR